MTTKVTEKPKKIKTRLNFGKLADPEFIKRLDAIDSGVYGHPQVFSTPPVDAATFKAGIDTYNTLTTDALDGGKKAVSAKRKQREVMIKMAMQLGHYVWAASNNDLATFDTSGFEVAANTKVPPQPLPQAKIRYVDRGGASGQVSVRVEKLKGAVSYELRYAPLTAGSSTPAAPWVSMILPSPKALTINNLTVGTNYQFEVRAIGRLGYSDWSDPVNYICTGRRRKSWPHMTIFCERLGALKACWSTA